jgi:hypothetical protein
MLYLRETSIAFARAAIIALVLSAGSALPASALELAAGTRIPVVLRQTISTATARAGDHITGEVAQNITLNGSVVVPKGSRIEGRVVSVTPSGRLSGVARLDFTMTELTPAGGQPLAIATSHYARTGKTHTKHEAELIGGGAALGALVGQAAGRDTKATLEGTAAGAVAGTAAAAATGKFDFQVPAGRVVTFRLRKAVRVS